MDYGLYEILKLVGSLCLFLFGMKTMSESIQMLAGARLRSFIGAMTSNPVMGIFTGLTVTAIIQSSSAVTVMMVSFVNAGLMTLAQAVGVIMGANIGTTITAWVITVLGFEMELAELALPIIGLSFPLMMMAKERFKLFGSLLLGFALLFLGLEMLKDAVPDLSKFPEYFDWLERFSGYGFFSVLKLIGLGALIVAVIQSSSAGMALILVFSYNGWIGFGEAAALVLGFDLGTTLTANLAALMGNRQAKRAAFAHTLFNLVGIIAVLLVFKTMIGLITQAMINMGMESPYTNPTSVPIGLSIFHTTFNIFNTLVVIGFVKPFVAIIEKIIPIHSVKSERPHLEYFNSGFLQAAELSVIQARKETLKFAELSHRMFNFIPAMIIETDKKEFEEIRERVSKYEEITDRVEVEITTFLSAISKKQLSDQSMEELRRIRLTCSEIEKIGDICFKMSTVLAKKREEKVYFTPAQRSELFEMFKLTNDAFEHVLESLSKGENFSKQNLARATELELRINAFRDAASDAVIEEIEKGTVHVKSAFYFNKLVTSSEKIGDNLHNIAEAIAGLNTE
ncbi:MAG TPA: Na/Pi cotransporter family protein [Bacteroidales bacterium]|nr:Na/Pi cotransporter family protein [Bacteroidales bacterium]